MSRTKTAYLAWVVCGIIILGSIFNMVRDISQQNIATGLLEWIAYLLELLWPVEFAVLAALILSRQPQNAIGWLLMVPALLVVVYSLPGINIDGVTVPPPNPSNSFLLAVWFNQWAWILFIFPILLIPLLFPSGRPPSPRWRWVVIYALVLVAIFIFLASLAQNFQSTTHGWFVPNPVGFIPNTSFVELIISIWQMGLVALTVLCVFSLFVRFRRAAAVEREQIKWLLYACFLFAIVYGFRFFVSDESSIIPLWNVLFYLLILMVPAAIAIAILRYRLWDIDVIIRKTLVYGALTAAMALVFFGGVTLLQSLFQAISGQQSAISIVISTLVIAALFNPLRTRIQNGIDRRFYRKKYNAEQTLARFAGVARDETDIDQLCAELLAVVDESMQPAQVSLWLKPTGGKTAKL
jgi:hypothetical protein